MLNEDIAIQTEHEMDIDIRATPWQDFRGQVEALSKRSRLRQAAKERTFLAKVVEIDSHVLAAALKNRNQEDKRILQHILTGATWTQQQMYNIGKAPTNLCKLCGQPELDIRILGGWSHIRYL